MYISLFSHQAFSVNSVTAHVYPSLSKLISNRLTEHLSYSALSNKLLFENYQSDSSEEIRNIKIGISTVLKMMIDNR